MQQCFLPTLLDTLMIRKSLFILSAFAFFSNASFRDANAQSEPANDKPMNVILLIGDGMGLAQVSTIYYGDTEVIHFDRFTHTGLIKTWSSKEKVTDSASSATAYSAGIKTYNGAIAVDDNAHPVETIIERVEDQNISTGLLATSSITHATPAAFYAHVRSRQMHEAIASYMPQSGVDFFAGGGLKFFAGRSDGLDVFAELESNGFSMDSTSLNLSSELEAGKKYGYLLAADGMLPILEGRGSFLPDATRRALDYFSLQDGGFFMMVEGSQIDWGGHANNYDYLATELIDFNEAIGISLDYAEEHGNTLVIVTADHETGGLALPAGDTKDQIQGAFSTGSHTATLIPVFAFGPGAERFTGVYQNNDIFHKIVESTGW